MTTWKSRYKMIENQTVKKLSDVFLWSAICAITFSSGLKIAANKLEAHFVGQSVAPLLLPGLYNKLVKIEGYDAYDKAGAHTEQ